MSQTRAAAVCNLSSARNVIAICQSPEQKFNESFYVITRNLDSNLCETGKILIDSGLAWDGQTVRHSTEKKMYCVRELSWSGQTFLSYVFLSIFVRHAEIMRTVCKMCNRLVHVIFCGIFFFAPIRINNTRQNFIVAFFATQTLVRE